MLWATRGNALSPLYYKTAMAGMLFLGTVTTIVRKIPYSVKAPGRQGKGDFYSNPHRFQKPWFQTGVMCVAELLALFVYAISRRFGQSSRSHLLVSITSADSPQPDNRIPSYSIFKLLYWTGLAATSDSLGTVCANIGLAGTNASVWQMLRGSRMIFIVIGSMLFLKHRQYTYVWCAIIVALVGVVVVGVSSHGMCSDSTNINDLWLTLLTAGSQVIQAGYFVTIDYIVHTIFVDPAVVIGLSGLWGVVLAGFISLPIVQALPGATNSSIHEDTLDTFAMLKNSSTLIG
jgi:drug/metabolite transporter (DMT)-like permease